MGKKYLYHLWMKVRPIRPWYFLALAIMFSCLGVWGLRENNLHMASLRAAVYEADKNNGDVQSALQRLQLYVTHHMNTDLAGGPNAPYPPIQLVNTYDRAVLKAGEEATAFNSQIYSDAQKFCEKEDPNSFYGRYRVPCVQQYIHNHGVANVPTIPDAIYKFAFASPSWSPDVAGWSLVLAVLSTAGFVVAYIVRWFLRVESK